MSLLQYNGIIQKLHVPSLGTNTPFYAHVKYEEKINCEIINDRCACSD